MNQNEPLVMRMSLEVLKHLGFNLYSNVPAVISETVANAYDADASKVNIDITEERIIIEDNGHGMSRSDINRKFLLVGYAKRNDMKRSKKYNREFMGRKGIGKLSLFSLANDIAIHTCNGTEQSSFRLNRNDIEQSIKSSETYHPEEIEVENRQWRTGTKIILSEFKKDSNRYSVPALKKRLARRFSVIGRDFQVYVNGVPINLSDRDYFSKVQLMWHIGDETDPYSSQFTYKRINRLSGIVDEKENWKIHGWIGSVRIPADLEENGASNNKISLLCRGKMAKEDILADLSESGIFATYLIGEIHADFLDLDELEDIATSSRQSVKEDDPRYTALIRHFFGLIKSIKSNWTFIRTEIAEDTAIERAQEFSPALLEWYQTLKSQPTQQRAKRLFATIDNFHFDKEEERPKKLILYKQGILAFEKLRLHENLEKMDLMQKVSDFELSEIFLDFNELESNMYYDIASERVAIIKRFDGLLQANEKEKLIQQYLFDNLWLLHPSWERATNGTATIERNIYKEFDKITAKLSAEEKRGRYDIKYRTSAGKHIIIELKRYNPSYKVDTPAIIKQINKYREAMRKVLAVAGHQHEPIESVVVLGKQLGGNFEENERMLAAINTRVIYYDDLIAQSLESYRTYLDKDKALGKLRGIISKL